VAARSVQGAEAMLSNRARRYPGAPKELIGGEGPEGGRPLVFPSVASSQNLNPHRV